MNGASYRFGVDVGSRATILTIVQTYVVPIIEFGALIWRNDTVKQNKDLELPLRFARRRIQTRAPNLFDTTGLALGSRRILNFSNEYRRVIDLQHSSHTNRQQLKEYFMATRAGA